MFKRKTTQRGFEKLIFTDSYGAKCRLQESSAYGNEGRIWLGPIDADPKIMATQASQLGVETDKTCGWVEYPIPSAVLLTTEMHLTQSQVADMLPVLKYFVETGELPTWNTIPTMEGNNESN